MIRPISNKDISLLVFLLMHSEMFVNFISFRDRPWFSQNIRSYSKGLKNWSQNIFFGRFLRLKLKLGDNPFNKTVFMSQSTVRLSWPANRGSLGTVCGNLLLSVIRFPDTCSNLNKTSANRSAYTFEKKKREGTLCTCLVVLALEH